MKNQPINICKALIHASILALFSIRLAAMETLVPQREIDRGITPVGIVTIDSAAKISDFKKVALGLVGKFGVINLLEGNLSFDGVEFGEKVKVKKALHLGAKYNFWSNSFASTYIQGDLPFHFSKDEEVIQYFTIGLPIAIFNDHIAGGFLGDLFTLTMKPEVEFGFDFPLWVGVQVANSWWVELSTSLGSIKLSNKENKSLWEQKPLWQELPVELGARYAMNHYVDIGAQVGLENSLKAKDAAYAGVNISVRMGRLFKQSK